MGVSHTISTFNTIRTSNLYGLWEVIRICEGNDKVSYPWLKERFMFDFLDENRFICIKEGHHSSGTWELKEIISDAASHFSIILNDTLEYMIVAIDEDELILTYQNCEYLLYKKL